MNFLVIDEDKALRDARCTLIANEGHVAQPTGSAEAALTILSNDDVHAVLLDTNIGSKKSLDLLPQILRLRPGVAVAMLACQGSMAIAVEAMRRGAVDCLEKPFTREQLYRVVSLMESTGKASGNGERLEQKVKHARALSPELLLDFTDPMMREIECVLERGARTQASILLLGESGTGKSVLARIIHQQSHLAANPLVTVSCPSLSRELLESELFGHVKGAFTGAVRDHWGKVKAAHGGTLFLDEIGDLPMEIQPKLLRLLQEREYERLGENVTCRADLRIIAATNRNLEKRMAEGAFREDLYFRLSVITAVVPPLRERPEYLQRLADHYLQVFAAQCGRTVRGYTDQARERMAAYHWPGNLRELRNALERAVILSRDELIDADDLPLNPRHEFNPVECAALPGDLVPLKRLEELHIRKVIKRTPSILEAARVLGIDQATLYRKRKKMTLDSAPDLCAA